MTFLILSQLGGDGFGVAAAVLAGSLRQSLLPQEVLGRVGGAFQAVAGGTVVVGSLLGGYLATAIGIRETLMIAACGLLIAPIIVLASPLRKVRTMEG
jgi:MFS family permease